MAYQITAGIILIAFYGIYTGKMFAQRKKGIQTDQMAKGVKNKRVFMTELILKIATYSAVAAEAASIIINSYVNNHFIRIVGIVLSGLGTAVFGVSVYTMRDSWRAGIPEKDHTQIVTGGIYRFSRNPAFLGFDFVYLGILLVFFNWVLLLFSLFAAVMLHLQILQEEKYLLSIFGKSYQEYRGHVRRYL